MIKVTEFKMLTDWELVAEVARVTSGKDALGHEPSQLLKYGMACSEHSPLRALIFKWRWENLPSWVSVHFVRHKFGIEHFVKSQRTDRTGIDRNELPQNAPVMHECIADAQSILNISRKRLCGQASVETRFAWNCVINKIREVCPELAAFCVPECVYRGFCPEFKSCGFAGTKPYYEGRCRMIQAAGKEEGR